MTAINWVWRDPRIRALVAAVGRAESFDRGRDRSAWLGIVARQFTTGKPKLLGVSKRGDSHLRRRLIHGAPRLRQQAGSDRLGGAAA